MIRCLASIVSAWCLPDRLLAEPVEPPTDYVAQMWTTEDGLPHNQVNQVVQDQAGFIWIATAGGLTRFDGRAFKDFPIPPTSQKQGANVRGLAKESPTTLLVLPAGDEVLRLENGVFHLHPISPALAGQAVTDIFVEPGGALWVGTATGRLFRWQAGRIHTFGQGDGIDRRAPVFSFAIDEAGRTWVATGTFFGHYQDGRLVAYPEPQGRVVTIASARSGGVWVLASGQLKKLENGKLTTLATDPPWMRLNASVRNLCEDRGGRLWLAATHHGVFWYEHGQFNLAPLISTTVQDLHQDREGNLWVGTATEGIGMVRTKRFRLFDETAGFRQKVTFSVSQDETGALWFANGKGGLFRRPEGTSEPIQEMVPRIEANRVVPDGRGNLWAAGEGLVRISTRDTAGREKIDVPIRRPNSLFVARNGDLWIAGTSRRGGAGYLRNGVFHPVSLPEQPDVTALAEDRAGSILIGSGSGRLFACKDGNVQPIPAQRDRPLARILCLFVDSLGTIWMGTVDGLYLVEGDRFQRLDVADGLRDSIILQILEDDLGHLWFGSRRGLFRVAREELIARVAGRLQRVNSLAFGKDQGLPGILPVVESQPSAWKDRRGHLWFATQQGVVSIDPAALAEPVQLTVLIDEARLDQQTIDLTRGITVPPGAHRLEFRFVAPSSSPANVRFRYRLEGFDPAWIELEAGQLASYSHVPPGRYHLHVVACDSNGRWHEQGVMQTVTVIPAWWQRTWIRGCASLVALSLATALIRYVSQVKLRRRLAQIEAERVLDQERTRIARDVHDELGSGVTSVRLLVSRLKPGALPPNFSRVVEQLTRQTQHLAFALERVVWTVHPKSNSVDQLAAFIGRFAQNLLEGSEVQCIVRRALDIPPHPMAPETQHHVLAVAKEALNNVLKHSGAREVVIETSYHDSLFSLTISDDGTGFVPDAAEHSQRNGLSNMRSRAEEMGGRIEIHSATGKGTRIHLSILMKSPIPTMPPSPA